jgi:hypothetical protein
VVFISSSQNDVQANLVVVKGLFAYKRRKMAIICWIRWEVRMNKRCLTLFLLFSVMIFVLDKMGSWDE